MQVADREEPEAGDHNGQQDLAGHPDHTTTGDLDIRVTQQPKHHDGNDNYLEQQRKCRQHIELGQIVRGGHDRGQHADDQGLHGIQADLGSQQ